jgi:urease accessory protein
MIREANEVRGGRPVMLSNCKSGEGIEAIIERLIGDVVFLGAGEETQRHGDAA